MHVNNVSVILKNHMNRLKMFIRYDSIRYDSSDNFDTDLMLCNLIQQKCVKTFVLWTL